MDAQGSSSPKAIKSDHNLTINGGNIKVNATGGDGAEGLEGKKDVLINGGNLILACYDDGINSSDGLSIKGGNIFITSWGNDGMDSNGYIYIHGGNILAVSTSYRQAGIDNDGKTFSITGGRLIFIGDNARMPFPNLSKQPTVIYKIDNPTRYVNLQDADGNNIFTVQSSNRFPMRIMFSWPELAIGKSYDINCVQSLDGGKETLGILSNPVFGSYTQNHFTISSPVTTLNP